MSGHTPGPWMARIDPAGSPSDACIGLDDDVTPIDYIAVCQARDARLIAAAPELLEALTAALPLLAHGSASFENCDCVVKVARAAIAKATGEPE